MKPEELLYTESHEWVRVTSEDGGAKVATIGITAFAVEQLTDLVFMQLPAVGKSVEAGTEFGEVESVKAVSSLYAPVSGEVIAVNSALPSNLEVLKTDPYGEGWMIKVRLSSEADLARLLDHASYTRQCAEHG